jgi:beta-xylosidase
MKKQAFNPYLPLNEYIPDAEPHVFGDRIYIYGSHDKENGETFCMLPYTVWSAPVTDLSDWTCAGVVFDQSEDPLYDEETEMIYTYAPDVVQGNDGRFYMYYCLSGRDGHGGYTNPISVAVSDRPDGPFRYLGVVHDKNNLPLMRYVCFDPAVINDEGTIRIYFGTDIRWMDLIPFSKQKFKVIADLTGRTYEEEQKQNGKIFGAYCAQLEDDMLTLRTVPVRIDEDVKGKEYQKHVFFEASSTK